ncbi:MAG: ribosomal RNA small subunit methyltransferase A [Candidatus Harrisonbacteria bacterium CG10_big_fil_rev_8_21_14_0_10_40_38]|uniref:Ribosomal RNA small subunit methyltransferase A n=1 Tax=Candidatus Harrisonbacteria bacterium CG10_big_fil_rev_8_21_14_0_10_40_38 TaxID=1974583 RepID=A0A2H0URG7_9BACT|nr:MAG: ribosomal RNA small subunit methyltransferase A [Candidatus Harrisonbacteria bacterium CG10_big_fil_rev_8_21_14_0_10_40_38]
MKKNTREPLGQHFLKSKKAVIETINSASPNDGDTIIEIGPGKGFLTKEISKICHEKNCSLIAIEKDCSLAEKLKKENLQNTEIITDDALKFLKNYKNSRYKLIGNIPYYITGKLLRILSENPIKPEKITLLIQEEVAERIEAKAPNMNLLSAITGVWADSKILMRLNQSDFNPPPKVRGAIIEITPKKETEIENIDAYFKTVKLLFRQPRKTLLNNIRDGFNMNKEDAEKIIKENGMDLNDRPQNTDMKVLINITKTIQKRVI